LNASPESIMPINGDAVGRTIAKGAQTAGALEKSRAPSRTGAADIWVNGDPPPSPTQVQVKHVKDAAAQVTEAEGALATVGAAMGTLTAAEQAISAPLAAIPFPRFPALRITDLAIGLPHAHAHPPNLIPPAPPVPLPSTGPVIKIPILSGANAVFMNGLPAARCGDIGLGIWCGGYFPLYEIFLGSSHVWIEGSRAARLGVDITKHCVFTTPRPSDPPMGPMVGTTITGSANVLIGGIPLPSLTNMAVGAALKVAFKGLGKVVRALRPAERAAEGLAVFRRGAKSAGGKAISLRQLRMKLGRAGVDTSGYAFRKATAEEVADAGKRVYGWVNADGAGRVFRDAKGRPIINFTDNGLSSLKEGVKTFGHEASHIKDYVAGIKFAREDVAEKAGERLWENVSGALERRNR
jgi:uncharacterized Zn-binding protein involved in type VI secretion